MPGGRNKYVPSQQFLNPGLAPIWVVSEVGVGRVGGGEGRVCVRVLVSEGWVG